MKEYTLYVWGIEIGYDECGDTTTLLVEATGERQMLAALYDYYVNEKIYKVILQRTESTYAVVKEHRSSLSPPPFKFKE